MSLMQKLTGYNLAWATDWTALFNREAPLILEIGFGKGTYLAHLARTNPDCNVIGVEIANRSLDLAEQLIAQERLDNVRIVHATAELALHHLFTPQSITQIHINFPDPWFKAGHVHRRLMQRDTLNAIVSRLKPDGLLYLATDIIDYAEMSAALLDDTPTLDNVLPSTWINEIDGRIITKYEATAKREGRACYYFVRQRNHQPAPPVPVIQELDMPHVTFSIPLSLDDIQAEFKQMRHTADDLIINVESVYRGQNALLFEVFVKETTIHQRVAILLQTRADGNLTILLSTLGAPRPTPGIHHAVKILRDWIFSLHPEVNILQMSLQQ